MAANVYYGIRSLMAQPPQKMKRKTRSQSSSQGVNKFSGSGYNSPGNVDSSKKRYNRKRR